MSFETVTTSEFEQLLKSVSNYIDDHYINNPESVIIEVKEEFIEESIIEYRHMSTAAPMDTADWGDLLDSLDAGFSETLLQLIDRTGKKDSEIYRKASVDRKLFSKIRTNMNYQPSKTTALAFAFALELDIEETRDFIGRAGYALSHSSKFDVIVEYFLINKNYNIHELNEVLLAFDQPLIGA